MKIFKKYLPDILILGGTLLLVINYYFKITEYNVINSLNLEFDLDFTTIEYDYVGFVATVIVVVGVYLVLRKYLIKK